MKKQMSIGWKNMYSKVYIDTNIALDLLLDSRPFSNETKNLLLNYGENTIFTINNLSLSNIFYVGAFQNKQYKETFSFLKQIETAPKWQIYDLTKNDRLFCYDFMSKNIGSDFEDLLQYIAAKNSHCGAIITNDANFPKLDISLIRTNPNMENYLPTKP